MLSSIDPNQLPDDVEALKQMVIDLRCQIEVLKRMVFGRRSEKRYDDPNQSLLFGQLESDENSPAEEEAQVVSGWCAITENRMLGTAAGMKSKSAVIQWFAILELNMIAYLEAVTVTVIILDSYIIEVPVIATLNKYTTGIIAIDQFIVGLIALQY